MHENHKKMKSYSQWGEDVEVLNYFGKSVGVFIEVGANHPTLLSQTYLLEEAGWSGVLIEPNPRLAELLIAERKQSVVFQCAVSGPQSPKKLVLSWLDEMAIDGQLSVDLKNGSGVVVNVRTLDDILIEAGLQSIDFMAIDIEGLEIEAMKGFDFNEWRPRLILIEDHWDSYRKHIFLRLKGYKLVKRSVINSWYIPIDETRIPNDPMSIKNFIYGWCIGCAYRSVRKFLRSLLR